MREGGGVKIMVCEYYLCLLKYIISTQIIKSHVIIHTML